MPRSLVPLLLALALAVTACEGGATTTTFGNLGTPLALPDDPPVTTAVRPTTTAPPPTSTTVPLGNPLTRRVISDEELLLMTMEPDDLPFPFFVLSERKLVANEDAPLLSLREPADEAADIALFERQGGATADFELPRLPGARRGILGVHVSVQLFATVVGASGYLADFFEDAAKGLGGGRPAQVALEGMDPFVVEDVGEEAVAFTLRQRQFGEGGAPLFETLVAIRVGRIVAFGSIVHEEDADFRLRAINLAEHMEQRLLDVLRGVVQPPEPEPEPEPLLAYAWDFRQQVDRGIQLTTVDTEGVELVDGDALSCDFRLDVDGLVDEKRYVLAGDDVWFDILRDGSEGFTKAGEDTAFLRSDVIFCPGWAVPLEDSRLNVVLADRRGEAVDVGEEARAGLRYELTKDDLVAMGFLPEATSIAVTEFVVTTDATEPWLLELRLVITGPSRSFVAAYGDEFEGVDAGRITVRYEFAATRVNDPELAVEIPG